MYYSSRQFRTTFLLGRRNLQDTTFSGYMMSLVNMSVLAGWTDQEAVNLLSNFLRRHNAFRKSDSQFRLTRARIDSMLAKAKMAKIYAEQHPSTQPSVEKAPFRQNQPNLERIMRLLAAEGPMRQSDIAQRLGLSYPLVKNIVSRWRPTRLIPLADHLIGIAPEDPIMRERPVSSGTAFPSPHSP
jgi:hypothetical protein